TCRRSWTRSSSTPGPGRWATGRSSCCRATTRTACGRARPARKSSRPTRTQPRSPEGPTVSHEPAAPHRPAAPAGGPAGAAGLVARLRAVHLEMLDAVLSGDGLQRVAMLAADAAGAPVAIVVPRIGAAVTTSGAPGGDAGREELRRYVADRVADRPSRVPETVAAEVPIASGDELVGAVLLLGPASGSEAAEFLHLAAVASLTEVAVEEAREEVEENLRGSFLEDLRARPDLEGDEVVRRAARLGCDL